MFIQVTDVRTGKLMSVAVEHINLFRPAVMDVKEQEERGASVIILNDLKYIYVAEDYSTVGSLIERAFHFTVDYLCGKLTDQLVAGTAVVLDIADKAAAHDEEYGHE